MNLNSIVKQFFNENEYYKLADSILLIRQDGILVYTNIESELEASSMGALIGGVWQAAEALSSLTKKENDFLNFRLSFDTSSDGLYILPITIINETFYLGGVYSDADNPAKLKRNLRLLNNNLEMYLSGISIENEKRDGFLFENISDEEINNLFSFGGV